MRIGNNPEKEQNILEVDAYHRVVIPVYIPNLTEPYFKDGLKILKLCISSLLKTIHQKTRISIINNASCNEVSIYLEELYQKHESIDQLLNSKINLGKVNALYAAIKSNLEPIITISDADVMFLPNWQQAVEKTMVAFPECGMVSPVPSSIAYRGEYLNSTIYYAFFKGKLIFEEINNPDGLLKFEKSIGRKMYNETHLKKHLVLSNKQGKAVIGCGHFVATFRAEVFTAAPNENCKFKIVGGSEGEYLDKPNDVSGFLKLATLENYAYHLGNTIQPWMNKEMDSIENSSSVYQTIGMLPKVKPLGSMSFKIGKLLHKLFFKKLKKYYFAYMGVKQPY
ncbi:glycosyltransferase family A protein [Pontimicrobium sp. SW4]|uniref:Glycosyltransferase family A protein n=1 Tax=Pontimicrobium sp. SW4 TaxID=3153519 RepID=A0AAU7BV87_9FLAO